MLSGREVVTAATIAPVGAYCNGFRTRQDLTTLVRKGPWYFTCPTQRFQYDRVLESFLPVSNRDAGITGFLPHLRTKTALCPFESLNSLVRTSSSARWTFTVDARLTWCPRFFAVQPSSVSSSVVFPRA